MRVYRSDLGLASAYWSGAPLAAYVGVYNNEPYIAVGSDQSRGAASLEALGVTVDKPKGTHFGIIEDAKVVSMVTDKLA